LAFDKNDSTTDAIRRLLNDIKVFGLKIPEALNQSHLKNGYGESVCFIVNDLLNRELIRKDFKFEKPVIEEIKEEDYVDIPEEEIDEEAITLPLGVKTETNSDNEESEFDTRLPPMNIITSTGNKQNKNSYFTVSTTDGNNSSDNSSDYFQSGAMNFIESSVDPADWKNECARVKHLLVMPSILEQSESNSLMSSGGGNPSNSQLFEEFEYRERLGKIIEYIEVVKDFTNGNVIDVLNKAVDIWSHANDSIKMYEKRLNNSVEDRRLILSNAVERKRTAMDVLQDLRNNVKHRIDEFDELTDKCEDIHEKIEKLNENLNDSKEMLKIKTALREIRREVLSLERKTELTTALLTKRIKDNSKNTEIASRIDEIIENFDIFNEKNGAEGIFEL